MILKFLSRLIPERHFDEDTYIHKVLIIDLNYSGDLLMDSVAWKMVYQNLGIRADCLTYHSSREMVKSNPYVGYIHTVSKSYCSQLWMAYMLWYNNYDCIIHLNTSLKANFLAFIIGATYRVGYDYKHRGCFLNVRVPIERRTYCTQYRVREVIELFEKSFGWTIGTNMVFEIPEYRPPLVVLCVNTRTTQDLRRWDKFHLLADAIIEKYNASLLFVGAESDRDYIESVIGQVKNKDNCFTPTTSLNELARLLKVANLCVTVNTSVMHLAITMKTPLVALIGGTPSIVVLPENNKLIEYIEDPNISFDEYKPFMESITVESVMEKVDKLIGEKK